MKGFLEVRRLDCHITLRIWGPSPANTISALILTLDVRPHPINIRDFSYDLPADRIAYHPLAQRDQARLLYYKRSEISHRVFRELPELLPRNATLFFNETRVIPARFAFSKETCRILKRAFWENAYSARFSRL